MKPTDVTTTSLRNCTLHWAYLEFAIRASKARSVARKPSHVPVGRNIIEAIRYSYWASLQLSDKLGFLSFSKSGEGFWRTDGQRELFEDLKTVRNALTHPEIFGIEITEHSADFESPPTSTRKTVHGKMRRRKGSVFAEHPEELGRDDAKKAVEIALRHAARFEELFFSGGSAYFSRINTRTGKVVSAAELLARMRRRYFDTKWVTG